MKEVFAILLLILLCLFTFSFADEDYDKWFDPHSDADYGFGYRIVREIKKLNTKTKDEKDGYVSHLFFVSDGTDSEDDFNVKYPYKANYFEDTPVPINLPFFRYSHYLRSFEVDPKVTLVSVTATNVICEISTKVYTKTSWEWVEAFSQVQNFDNGEINISSANYNVNGDDKEIKIVSLCKVYNEKGSLKEVSKVTVYAGIGKMPLHIPRMIIYALALFFIIPTLHYILNDFSFLKKLKKVKPEDYENIDNQKID